MSGFDTDWLRLREPYDHAARSADLDARFARAVRERPGVADAAPDAGAILVDLGGGVGNTVRAVAPYLDGRQTWTVIDHDAGLLARLPEVMADWGRDRGLTVQVDGPRVRLSGDGLALTIVGRVADLASDDLGELLAGAHGVTASALLDLVSATWLERLAVALGPRPGLFALSYDGALAFDPADPDDDVVRSLFNAHQRGDKSFGPALGPDAAAVGERILNARGFAVHRADSPWRLGAGDRRILGDLVEGFATAASEQAPDRAEAVAAWRMRRLAAIDAGSLGLTVGHADLLALPLR
jgi:hypothetical protein